MGVFEQFPYVNMHEMNLEWLLKKMKELDQAMETFKATESLKFADPIIWDITTQYQKSTIVLDPTGNAYLSLQPVPTGVQLNNDEYWLEIFNFTDYTRTANQNLTVNTETNTTRATATYQVDDWLIWNDVLYRVTSPIAIDDALIVAPAAGSNIVHFTVEDFIKAFINYATGLINQYKNDIDASELAYRQQLAQDIASTTASLQAQLNAAIAGATVDSEVINARVGADGITYSTLGDAIRGQASNLFGAVAEKSKINHFIYSTNNNYLTNDNYVDGAYINSSGYISYSTNWKYKYYPIPFPGTFKIRRSTDEWGSYNQTQIVLAKGDGTFFKVITGTAINSNVVEFTISEDDFKFSPLLAVSTRKDKPNPMLIYDGTYPASLQFYAPDWNFNGRTEDIAIKYEYIKSVMLNENYVKSHDYISGFWSGTSLMPSSTLAHTLVPILKSGSYTKRERQTTFGTANIAPLRLADSTGTVTKLISGTQIDADTYTYTVTDADIEGFEYFAIDIDPTHPEFIELLVEGSATPQYYYWNKEDFKTNKLYKSTLVCDGDSICEASSDLNENLEGYYGRLRGCYSMSGQNYAVGGATITAELYNQGVPRHWISRNINTIYTDHPTLDYLILEGGTNDADLIGDITGSVIPTKFGSWNDTDYSGNYDDTTFCGAVESLFYNALIKFPRRKIGFIIPMMMGTYNSTIRNRRAYFDVIKNIAKKWHIPVLDLWDICQLNPKLTVYYDSTMTPAQNVAQGKYYIDGQHPDSKGYALMQDKINSWIETL